MAIYTLRSGGTAHPEDSVLQIITDLIQRGGVRDISDTNHFKVTEKAGTPDMSVDVAAGRAIVYEDANAYPVRNSATANKTVTANSSGNPRIDSVVLYIDLSASPSATSDNVAKLAVVAGTPNVLPVAPDDTIIGTAIGASNPYLVLATMTVPNGATEVEDADITDTRVPFKLKSQAKSVTVAYSGTLTLDRAEGFAQYIDLGAGNLTLNAPDNFAIDEAIEITVKQDGVGGRTITFWAGITWYGGTPVPTATASKRDKFLIKKLTATTYEGMVVAQDG